MTTQTISAYQGYGHRVQLVRRATIAREYAIIDNRRVLVTSKSEPVAKEAFINHVASIILQLSFDL